MRRCTLIPRKIPCRSCIAMVPCALLIENCGEGYQLRPLEESTSCDSRDSVIPSTSPSKPSAKSCAHGHNDVLHGIQWRQFVVYKAEEAGLDVVAIDLCHTSQTCLRCGFKHRANRRSQALFQCRHCGYTLHADLNTAKNIAAKYRASRGISSAGAPLSTVVSSPLPREERDKLPPLGDGR